MATVEAKKRKLEKQKSIKNLWGLWGSAAKTPEEQWAERVESRVKDLKKLTAVNENESLNARMFHQPWTSVKQRVMLERVARLLWAHIQKSNMSEEPYVLLNVNPIKPGAPEDRYCMEVNVANRSGKGYPEVDVLTIWEASEIKNKHPQVTNLVCRAREAATFQEQKRMSFVLCLEPWIEPEAEVA